VPGLRYPFGHDDFREARSTRFQAPQAQADRVNRAALVAVAVSLLVGCSSAPIPPTYTQDELREICERKMWWWHPNGIRGGYCEKR